VSGNDAVPAGQCTSTPRRARATVELLRQETPNCLASNLWPPNTHKVKNTNNLNEL